MTTLQLFTILGIFFLAALRPFVFYPCAKRFSPRTSCAFSAIWSVIGALLILPFFHHKLIINEVYFYNDLLAIGLGVLKGILLWFMIKHIQVVKKESNSCSVYFGFISIAIGACANYFLFNSLLTTTQIIGIILIGIMGLLFFIFGQAKKLSKEGKISFWLLVFILAAIIMTDHNAVSHTNWYVQFTVTGATMLIFSIVSGTSIKEWKNAIFDRDSVLAGIVYAAGGICLMSAMITILPVSMVSLIIRLAAPAVMVISAFMYKEGKWYEQAAFGGLTMAAALPLIF